MTGFEIRQALREGRMVYSSAVVAACPQWPKAMATAGVDFAFLDSEHTPVGRETLAWMCRAFASANIPPVVRIPSPDPFEAAKVLDGGATGFIAPYIESAEQVRQLTAVARYRPLKGQRVADALDDPDTLEPELRDYLDKRNADTIFIVNIESVPAIEALDDILSVGSIDSVLIGPHDLSCSLGIPEKYDHPRFDEAVRTIFTKAREHGVGAGIHFWLDIDMELEWITSAGGNLVMHSADLALYGRHLKAELDQIRNALGDDLTSPTADEDVV